MMRGALLWASTNPYLSERLPRYRFVQRATRRFMPGEALDDALREAEALARSGAASTVTLLGENLDSEPAADAVLDQYLTALDAISARGVDCEISVKPTQLGLDFGVEETRKRLQRLVEATDATVWVDMESSAYVDRTLELYREVRGERANVGVCLQSYLRRTQADLEGLLPLDPSIRLVKGAYREPAEVAFEKKSEVDQSFVRLTNMLLRAKRNGAEGRPVIATHDDRMIGEANRFAFEMGLDKRAYEFAMLYGIARGQQERLARAGHAVRVLVSYGSAWFPWYMRRLAERPANVWFVVKQLVRS